MTLNKPWLTEKSKYIETINGVDCLYEENLMNATKLYFLYGFNMGSCGESIVRGDLDSSRIRSHELLRASINEIYNMIRLCLPYHCLDDNVDNWNGFNNCSDETKAEILMVMMDNKITLGWVNKNNK